MLAVWLKFAMINLNNVSTAAKADIKTVGIVVKPDHAEAWKTACELSSWLEGRGIGVSGEPFCYTSTPEMRSLVASGEFAQDHKDDDLIIVLGGDGTMISTARLIGDNECSC